MSNQKFIYFYFKASGIFIEVPITEANNIIGIADTGKHIISSKTVAKGFLNNADINDVVITTTLNTELTPINIANA